MASPNNPTPARRKFDKAFKAEALRMLDEGQSLPHVAKSLNVSDQLLHTATAARLEARSQKTDPKASGQQRVDRGE